MSEERTYTADEIAQRLVGPLTHWRYEGGLLHRRYKTANWRASMQVANAVGYLAETAWHHPDLTVSWGAVEVALSTHSAGGITDKDFELATEIERVVAWRPGSDSALDGTPDEDPWRLFEQD
jgi:pterin-4a-carbinolamine dehydratase